MLNEIVQDPDHLRISKLVKSSKDKSNNVRCINPRSHCWRAKHQLVVTTPVSIRLIRPFPTPKLILIDCPNYFSDDMPIIICLKGVQPLNSLFLGCSWGVLGVFSLLETTQQKSSFSI